MRVALLAESFLPHMNGVTGSVLHVLRHLESEGHETLLIAPRAGEDPVIAGSHPDLRLMRSVPLPAYPDVRVVFARAARLAGILQDFRADVVHLASPFVLGWQGVIAAEALRIPSVAIYQTDVVAYARKYGMPRATALVAGHVARLHRRATLTLAPSSSSIAQLEDLGVDRLRRWGRGVDAVRFAPHRRSESWRAEVAPGERIVGYVGRLAPEKQVDDLRALADLPGTRLVVVGDGPARATLQRELPGAVFTGHLGGDDLARALASFDVFVHPGESETFCQTVQEALASGVPVVATGRGGPVDLVRSSVDGWLYRPGDLGDLRARVADLLGDDAKRAAFGLAARESVRDRTWEALGAQLVGHYAEARMLRAFDDALPVRAGARAGFRPEAQSAPPAPRRWRRYIALGDSLTEGLCDTSRAAPGEYRGWADRLAGLLATGARGGRPFRYANLAVRSKTVADVVAVQIPAALALRPDLVSILVGANDLVRANVDPLRLIARLGEGVTALRAAGCDVLLVTPFLPDRVASRLFVRRFAVFAAGVRAIAAAHGAMLLDASSDIGRIDLWAADRVHLRSAGHRHLAYLAAEVLGVPDAEALGGLDAALHGLEPTPDDDIPPTGLWLTRDALPWAWRRLRGRTAGDGRASKHRGYIVIPGSGTSFARTDPSA